MTVKYYSLNLSAPFAATGRNPEMPGYMIADTEAERPMSNLVEGDRIYCRDTDKWYTATSPTTWGQVGGTGGGAPTTVDYLVGTADGGLSAEIVVGTAPGGELGGTWASPTVDSSHAGSTHAATQAAAEATAAGALTAHEAAADPHTGYVKESDANWLDLTDLGATTLHTHAAGGHPDLATHDALGLATQSELDAHTGDAADAHDASAISILDTANDFTATDVEGALAELQADNEAHIAAADPHTGYVKENDANYVDLTDGGATTLHSHAGGGGINTLRTTSNQTINGGAGVFVDITGLTFPVVSGTDYAFDFYITFRSAATTTGWKAGVNCPAGTLDFWAGSDVIANGAAGVATHTERHNVTRDDMTLLTATIVQNVDLAVRIRGRYLCTANGTFAARFANELAANTEIVVQKGSWGTWF